jgi:hypothetical protein
VDKPKRYWNPPRPQKCLLKPEDVIKHLTVEEYNDYEVLTRQLEDVREKFEAGSELEVQRKHQLAEMVAQVLEEQRRQD